MNWKRRKPRRAAVYNAAADYFDHPVTSFWHRFGRRTVERLGPREGERVLDVCCGSGGSALPAAEGVGPHGKVVVVDLAERPVESRRQKLSRKQEATRSILPRMTLRRSRSRART
jgi:ubiquinone/menaquinone biosynthesis C-methylase UbiE